MRNRPKRDPIKHDRSHLRNALVSLRLTVDEFSELDQDAADEQRGMGFVAYRRYCLGRQMEKAQSQEATV